MNRSHAISPPAASTSRTHRLHAIPASHLALVARGLLVLGLAAAVLLWLISVGILIHDLVSWWAEFAVQPLNTAGDGPPPGW